MLNIVLYEPEIPPNTGNIIRLCANTGTELHLIHPLGFNPTDKQVKRAGLDYHEWARVHHYQDYSAFKKDTQGKNIYALSTKGNRFYTDVQFQEDDFILLGPETRGLPSFILEEFFNSHIIRIPMMPHSRSLNLANAAAIVVYESLRQNQFQNGKLV